MRSFLALLSLVGCIGVVLLLSVRTRASGTNEVASYADLKKKIRAGDLKPGPEESSPDLKPPLPTEAIFALENDRDFLDALYDSVSHKAATQGEGALNASQMAVLSVWLLEAEVLNGGFDQYFFNSTGDLARQALASLEMIGAARTAAIVRKAIALFGPEGPSTDREERWKQTDRFGEAETQQLGALDTEFFKYPDPISDLLVKYCRAHRSDF